MTTIQTKGWWCTACGEGILDGNALGASETVYEQVPTFEAALDLVPRLLEHAFEVAIFLRGTFIWSSLYPKTANRFEHWE